ncbi:MAG: Cysteine rich repeat [bacterium]|nr:Cysteine rich repeat [bacterium]
MRLFRTTAFAVASVALGFAGAAGAQEKPCMADAARLCPEVEPGGGAQISCLKSHASELSPACKKKVMSAKIKQEEKQQLEQQQQQQAAPPPSQPRP